MANRYWVGGSGTWDVSSTANWSLTSGGAAGASAPTTADFANFDANSGTAATITVASTAVAGNTGISKSDIIISLAGNAQLSTSAITGSVVLTAGTLTLNNFTLTTARFSSDNSNTRTINFGTGNIDLIAPASVTILNFATATGFTWTGTGGFTRNQAAAATISFGSTAGGNATTAVNLTINSGASDLTITTRSHLKTLNFTGSTSTVTGVVTLYGNLTLDSGGTYTGFSPTFTTTQTFTSLSKTLSDCEISGAGITVTLSGDLTVDPSRVFTLTQGTLDLAGFTLNTGIFGSNNSNARSIAFGSGNIALTSALSTTILAMSAATNFTVTGTGGFTRNQAAVATVEFGISGGSPTNAPNLSVTAGSSALTITNGSYFKNLSFSGSTSSVTGTSYVAGNLTLGSGTYTSFTPYFYGAGTITTNGKQIQSMYVDTGASTLTLADSITIYSTNAVTLYSGTLNLAGFTISTYQFNSSNSSTRAVAFGTGNISAFSVSIATATGFTWTGTGGFIFSNGANITFGTTGGTVSNAPNVNILGTSSATVTFTNGSYINILNFSTSSSFVSGAINVCGNLTLSASSSGIYNSFAPTFVNSASITNNNRIMAALTINGSGITVTLVDALNITNALTFTQGTLKLKTGTSNTVGSFVTSGTTLKYLQSTTPGALATLSDSSGTNTATYLSIQDSAATGGATWVAGTGCVYAGNNTGWLFNSGNMFLAFF